jgi:hypothetical protein
MAAGGLSEADEFVKISMDQRWVDRSPQTMLETFHWFRGEGFGLIIEDLLALPPDQGVIAEGFRLLPHLVKPLLHDPSHTASCGLKIGSHLPPLRRHSWRRTLAVNSSRLETTLPDRRS